MRCCLFTNLSERFATESPPRMGRLVSHFFLSLFKQKVKNQNYWFFLVFHKFFPWLYCQTKIIKAFNRQYPDSCHRGEGAREWEMGRVGDGKNLLSSLFPLPSSFFPLPSLKLKNRPVRLPEVGGHVVKLPQFHSVYGQFLRRVQPLLV